MRGVQDDAGGHGRNTAGCAFRRNVDLAGWRAGHGQAVGRSFANGHRNPGWVNEDGVTVVGNADGYILRDGRAGVAGNRVRDGDCFARRVVVYLRRQGHLLRRIPCLSVECQAPGNSHRVRVARCRSHLHYASGIGAEHHFIAAARAAFRNRNCRFRHNDAGRGSDRHRHRRRRDRRVAGIC